MPRWAIQIVTLAIGVAAFIYGLRLYRRYPPLHAALTFPLVWLAHAIVFYLALAVRVIACGGDPPYSALFTWWSGVLRLHAALATLMLFWSLARRG